MKTFKYQINQVVENNDIGRVRVYDRWHGKVENFYDVKIIGTGKTWTYSEFEMLHGYGVPNPYLKDN